MTPSREGPCLPLGAILLSEGRGNTPSRQPPTLDQENRQRGRDCGSDKVSCGLAGRHLSGDARLLNLTAGASCLTPVRTFSMAREAGRLSKEGYSRMNGSRGKLRWRWSEAKENEGL